jgi:RimJ/RimL family protein N-acetyltransferase
MHFSPSLIETERLYIRLYQAQDALPLHQLVSKNEKSLEDYFPATVNCAKSVQATNEFIQTRIQEAQNGISFIAGVFEKNTNQLIGQMIVKDINWRVPKCEMGYFIDAEKRQNGFATEAFMAMTQFCFKKAGMIKLLLRIEGINLASVALAQKCGFTLSGILRNDFRASDGRIMDCEVWEKIKVE